MRLFRALVVVFLVVALGGAAGFPGAGGGGGGGGPGTPFDGDLAGKSLSDSVNGKVTINEPLDVSGELTAMSLQTSQLDASGAGTDADPSLSLEAQTDAAGGGTIVEARLAGGELIARLVYGPDGSEVSAAYWQVGDATTHARLSAASLSLMHGTKSTVTTSAPTMDLASAAVSGDAVRIGTNSDEEGVSLAAFGRDLDNAPTVELRVLGNGRLENPNGFPGFQDDDGFTNLGSNGSPVQNPGVCDAARESAEIFYTDGTGSAGKCVCGPMGGQYQWRSIDGVTNCGVPSVPPPVVPPGPDPMPGSRAADVTLDTTNFDNQLSSSTTNVQIFADTFDNLDTAGLARAPRANFNDSFSIDATNLQDYINREIIYGAKIDKNVDVTLPGNALTQYSDSTRINYPYFMRFEHLGGTFSSSGTPLVSNNRVRVNARSGQTIVFNGNRVSTVNMGKGQVVEFRLDSAGSDWVASSIGANDPRTTVLPDQAWRFEPQTVSLADSTALARSLVGINPLTGFAYVVGGTAGQEFTAYFGETIHPGDTLVSKVDGPDLSTTSTDWLVVRAGSNFPVSAQEIRFLELISEADDFERGPQIVDGDFQAWITPNLFATGPFIDPGSDPQNPRPGADGPYFGGRNSFTHGSNAFAHFLYVGFLPSRVDTQAEREAINVVVTGVDGDDRIVLNLEDQFRADPVPANQTFRYFVFNAGGPGDATTFNYVALDTIRGYTTRTIRRFSADPAFDATANVSNIGIDQLDGEVVARLTQQNALTHDDRIKLDEITETASDAAFGSDLWFLVRYGAPSMNVGDCTPEQTGIATCGDYGRMQNDQGLIPDFRPTPIAILVPDSVTLTQLERGLATVAVTPVTPSLVHGFKTYMATLPAAATSNPLNETWALAGTRTSITELDLGPLYNITHDNLDPALIAEIDAHPDAPTLPAALQALGRGGEVFTFDDTLWRSRNPHMGVASMGAFLKAQPTLGSPYPITANLFVNEVVGSAVGVSPPSTLASIYIPREVGGQLDNGIDVITHGAMTGPGIVEDSFDIEPPDDNNYRVVIGGRFSAIDPLTGATDLVRIKERGTTDYRSIVRANAGGFVFRQSNQDGGTFSETITHTLYSTNGELSHTFTGVAAQEELWNVYEARTYTFNVRLIANGNDEGSATFSYVVNNIDTSQAATPHTFTFANGHTQNVTVEYVANSSTYGGPGHTLRMRIEQLADNVNFDIDHLIASVTYTTTNSTTRANTYSSVDANAGSIVERRPYSFILSLRKASVGDDLEAVMTVFGYDSAGRATVYDINTEDFNYSVFDLDYSSIRVCDDQIVCDNVQIGILDTDTPLNEFPTHAVLHDWVQHYGGKTSDWVWGNAIPPNTGIEAVRLPEPVVFPNLFAESPDGSRWRLGVTNAGATAWTKVE